MNIANSPQRTKNILIVVAIAVLMLSSSGFLNLMANPIRNNRKTAQNCVAQAAPASEFHFDGQATATTKCDETSSSWFAIRYTVWGALSGFARVVGRILPIALVAVMVMAALSRLRSARTIDVMREREIELKQQLDDELKR